MEFNSRPTLSLEPAPLGFVFATVLVGFKGPQLLPDIGLEAKLPAAGCKIVTPLGLTIQFPKIGFRPKFEVIGLDPQTVQDVEAPPVGWW